MTRYEDLNHIWKDRAFKHYGRFTDRPARYLARLMAFSLLLAVAIGLGGWRAGWWFETQNVNRESHLFRNSYAAQQTLRDQITQDLGNVLTISSQIAETHDKATKTSLREQRYAIVQIACQEADQVVGDPLPRDQRQFVKANCTSGNVKPSSDYSQGVAP